MKPDSLSDKQRKRRSSRTGGLSGTKDPFPNMLMFRSVPEDRYNIYDWQIHVQPLLTAGPMEEEEEGPLSPLSPAFAFTNPFSNRDSRRPSSSANRPDLGFRSSTQNSSAFSFGAVQRERPSAMISPSPSLRSRRSDLSSQASSLQPPMGFTSAHPQTYTNVLPSDLPSPASTSGYDNQLIEGWTSAQGRSSALSSHTRASNSIASAVSPGPIGSTPPNPRETILDRAFQMRYIPGGDRVPEKDEEKISSIARFEALMREVDERKQARAAANQTLKETQGWELGEDSEESDNAEPTEQDNEEDLAMSDDDLEMPTPAQRALDYISGRPNRGLQSSHRPLSPAPRSPPIPFLNSQAMSAFHGQGGLRPRSGTSSSQNKTHRPNSLALPSRSISTNAVPLVKDGNNLKAGGTDSKEKRRSSTSAKRLSFQEFAKRLSSTSSLLLVQTNASSSSGREGSRRTSSEYGADEERIPTRGSAMPANERDKRCGWRGSVGVFGSEGGFL